MSILKKFKLNLVVFATILLWFKTYLVYKINFSINTENIMQEVILFLNPLSFIMLVLGIGIFLKGKKRNIYILVSSFLISFVLYANAVYYREFNDFITIPLLMQTNNLGDLGNSIIALVSWFDFFYFIDLGLILLMIKKQAFLSNKLFSKIEKKAFYFITLGLMFLNIGLAETQRPELLTRTFDREILVKNIGTYHFHIYDAVLHTKTKAQRAMADGNELVDIENFTNAHFKEPNGELFGIAKGKNIILISLESLQNFVIGETVNGEEITPFLNQFIKESFYFDHFYHQTGQGKTSDSEFLLDNSLYPLGRGAVFFTHGSNEYDTLTKKLKENGYFTSVLHANNKSFWNRDVVYQSFGYDRFYSLTDFEVSPEISVNWGMKDIQFFEQSIHHLKEMPKPLYAKFITLTNHFPFTLDEEDRYIDEYDSQSGTLNRYFPTVRYMDEAVKLFIEDLKNEGLYEESIIVMYGDHYGISENHNKAMGQFLNKEITPFDTVQLQRVPLIIHIPGQEGRTISSISGQIDLKPTILHLMGINTKGDIQFGTDLFANDRDNLVILRDGSFITNDFVFTKETCYDKLTGEVISPSSCEPYTQQVKQELEYSDKVIYGDLLRFFDKTQSQS
ncbi:LTA synthase family protein [Bacillus aquiflavi]|uniref:LTA synthase family protein n=1 Tax=Bacillus aquiflavi TaxID=2672567 RepID=A0A6B3W4R0_9BACI|nr:LTA synthase family protein [Bacillus aquiflavi]MBA4538611.1 LTA synthase family protein [Bacillus aquiflavi]NEY82973.1 LTA synthase family protein [Bacillus aquiflavi]